MLARVDHFVNLALDITQLFLLSSELVRLSELLNLALKVSKFFTVCGVLQLQVIVVFDQSLNLLLKCILVHSSELVFKASLAIDIDRSETVMHIS